MPDETLLDLDEVETKQPEILSPTPAQIWQ